MWYTTRMRENKIRPERFSYTALGNEHREQCNGQSIEYFEHVDFRKYHLHKISLMSNGGHPLFSFEVENTEFDKFLKVLIEKNPDLACTLLQEVVKDKVDSASRLLQDKAVAIKNQLTALEYGKYI